MRSLDTRHGFVVFPLKTYILLVALRRAKEREGWRVQCSIGTHGRDGELLRREERKKRVTGTFNWLIVIWLLDWRLSSWSVGDETLLESLVGQMSIMCGWIERDVEGKSTGWRGCLYNNTLLEGTLKRLFLCPWAQEEREVRNVLIKSLKRSSPVLCLSVSVVGVLKGGMLLLFQPTWCWGTQLQ